MRLGFCLFCGEQFTRDETEDAVEITPGRAVHGDCFDDEQAKIAEAVARKGDPATRR